MLLHSTVIDLPSPDDVLDMLGRQHKVLVGIVVAKTK